MRMRRRPRQRQRWRVRQNEGVLSLRIMRTNIEISMLWQGADGKTGRSKWSGLECC